MSSRPQSVLTLIVECRFWCSVCRNYKNIDKHTHAHTHKDKNLLWRRNNIHACTFKCACVTASVVSFCETKKKKSSHVIRFHRMELHQGLLR